MKKKVLSLILALCMIVAPFTVVHAEDTPVKVQDSGKLIEEIKKANGSSPVSIELAADITLTDDIDIPSGADITIDGKGYTISFPSILGTSAGGQAFRIDNSAENVKLILRNIVFEPSDTKNLTDGKPTTGFGVVVGEDTDHVSITAANCTFKNLWTGVYFGHVKHNKSGSLSISGCTYENVNYGYSVDKSTIGSGLKAVEVTSQDNEGMTEESEAARNVVYATTEGTIYQAYSSLQDAINAAKEGSTIKFAPGTYNIGSV